jgi:hypothetical protein
MNRTNLILMLALCLVMTGLGIAFGAQAFGCQQDELGADHVMFQAGECRPRLESDGTQYLECRRVTSVAASDPGQAI